MQVQVLFPARHVIRISRLDGRLVRIFFVLLRTTVIQVNTFAFCSSLDKLNSLCYSSINLNADCFICSLTVHSVVNLVSTYKV